MSIQVELIRENSVVLQTYRDPLDSAQMNALKMKMEREIFPTAAGKMHIIADFTGVKNLPGTILSSGSSMLQSAHPNTGTIVCVTASGFIQSMARVFSVLSSKQSFRIVSSLDHAFAEIDQLLADKI
ncbi:MAG: hypothetical protein ABI690_06675 [Chloroflexota bacterium]